VSKNNKSGTPIILVVEDDPFMRHTLVQALTFEGYQVTEAESGNSALSLLEKKRVDLIISDIQMPDGDGLALLAKVQKMESPPPLIFVSGHMISLDEVRALGAIDLLEKPFNCEKLLEVVTLVIAKAS
jgi:DNA-binding response OmpR family regulator